MAASAYPKYRRYDPTHSTTQQQNWGQVSASLGRLCTSQYIWGIRSCFMKTKHWILETFHATPMTFYQMRSSFKKPSSPPWNYAALGFRKTSSRSSSTTLKHRCFTNLQDKKLWSFSKGGYHQLTEICCFSRKQGKVRIRAHLSIQRDSFKCLLNMLINTMANVS